MIRRQRAAVLALDAVADGSVVRHRLVVRQGGGGGLPFELDVARELDQFAEQDFGVAVDGGDDGGGDGLGERVVHELWGGRRLVLRQFGGEGEMGFGVLVGRGPFVASPGATYRTDLPDQA